MVIAHLPFRHSGLPLYHFKCAWFDESNYFESYPHHVVHKKRKLQEALESVMKLRDES